MFKQWDVVQILTTKRIYYLSGPEGYVTNPQGNWSIVGFVEDDALLSKDNTLVRIPISDIRKVAEYNIGTFFEKLSMAGYKKSRFINVVDGCAEKLKVNPTEIREFLINHNLKLEVKTQEECNSIIERVEKLWLRKKKNDKNMLQ